MQPQRESQPGFHEATWAHQPIARLGLTIDGTRLQPLVAQVQREVAAAGLVHVRCRYYLSTEWGVPFGTVAVALPFYLADPRLTELHAQRQGFVEGTSDRDILRYLRHEVGHAVNYAYRLYEDERWIETFGAITRPYVEEYRPEPFSRRHVRHLPGWYAQKHPDEDWAETFAVWLTPGSDWRNEYAAWPEALAKLELCDRLLRQCRDQPPPVTATELDVDVSEVTATVEELYAEQAFEDDPVPPGLDGALRAIFEELGHPEEATTATRLPAADLIRRIELRLVDDVYRWTGHFPERTRPLLRYLAQRCDELKQVYPADREEAALLAFTTLVTALAANWVYRGHYLP